MSTMSSSWVVVGQLWTYYVGLQSPRYAQEHPGIRQPIRENHQINPSPGHKNRPNSRHL